MNFTNTFYEYENNLNYLRPILTMSGKVSINGKLTVSGIFIGRMLRTL